MEAVGKAVAGAEGEVLVSGAVPKRLARGAIVSVPTAGTRCPIKLDNLVFNNSVPSAGHP